MALEPLETRRLLPSLLRARWWVAILEGRDRRFTHVNEALRASLGFRELRDKTLAEALPDLGAAPHASAAAWLEGRLPRLAFDVPVTLDWLGDGVRATRSVSFASQSLAGGDASGGGATLVIALDVTEPEEGPAPAGAWPADVLDAIPVPTMLVEPDTRRVIFANEAARTIDGAAMAGGITFSRALGLETGYRCTDAEGRAIPDDQLPSMRASRGERVDGLELWWHTPTKAVPLLCFAERIEATPDAAAFVVLSFFDVTELRRHEVDLREARGARQAFLRRAAHELRTPLFALLLNVQALRRASPEPRGVAPIERATLRMVALVEQLLEMAEVADGAGFTLEDVDLVAVAAASLHRLAPTLAAAGCVAALTGAASLRGRWDAQRLGLLVDHLLSNAARFGPGEPIRVACLDEGSRAALTVTDGGPGVPSAERAQIFDRYADDAATDPPRGLGMGLWLCRRIALALGGALSVEGEPGRGATFRLSLPKDGHPGERGEAGGEPPREGA